MAVFLSLAAMIIVIAVVVKMKQNARLKREFKNSVAYNKIVMPLKQALEKEGYNVSEYGEPKKAELGYWDMMFVSRDGESGGTIYFADHPRDLWAFEYKLILANAQAAMKKMAIRNGNIGVFLEAGEATAVNPPNIPKWLMIGAQVFRESGIPFDDPGWFRGQSYSGCKEWLNVMFK